MVLSSDFVRMLLRDCFLIIARFARTKHTGLLIWYPESQHFDSSIADRSYLYRSRRYGY
jgi:hypothetical protein